MAKRKVGKIELAERAAVRAAAQKLAPYFQEHKNDVRVLLPALLDAIETISSAHRGRGDTLHILATAAYAGITGIGDEDLHPYSIGGASLVSLIEAITIIDRAGTLIGDARYISSCPGIWIGKGLSGELRGLIENGELTLRVGQIANADSQTGSSDSQTGPSTEGD